MSPKKVIAGIEREVPQDTRSTVTRLFGYLHGQRIRLTVVAVSIVIYVALSIWNPMYSAIVINHLWQSVQEAWQTGTPFSVTATIDLGRSKRLTLMRRFSLSAFFKNSLVLFE